jgi:ergot alkaloid biosynthesis protein
MTERILITGGTGKNGRRIVEKLRQRGIEPRIASRSAIGADSVYFDWMDAETYESAAAGVRAVFLVAPTGVHDLLGAMQPFLEHAIQVGVKRFVLLSASSLEENGPMMGAVHGFLKRHAPHWNVLRPTWFMQNFSEQQHLQTICEEGVIYSATGDGRVPFIDIGDIAAVAVEALVQPYFPDRDLVLTGPEALSYTDVAQMISEAASIRVWHCRLSEPELTARFCEGGLPAEYAHTLAAMDSAISSGVEDRVTHEVGTITGCRPTSFAEFAIAIHQVWQK